ncbi:pentatricopeptide repeat-containing protein At4g20770-like [Lolium perenne]|uniref:pentatricopeptide repeat-containing protein At4g20770-like n=1 Tax=Lolium perenne TaxID=4522 RepID=UPI0021EA4DA2|nr:pentatricopeptide repeat-containing protein At4g20770-like [Lolium perenne]
MANPAAQLAAVLQACIKRSPKPSRVHAKAAHARVLAAGLAGDTFLLNRVVELYSLSGLPRDALRAFRNLPRPNAYSYNAALSAASRAGDLDAARALLDEMPEPNVVSWNTVIAALARSERAGEALELYEGMLREGLVPTHFTLASVLSACGAVAAPEDGRRCHGLAVKVGLDENQFVENALLGMYTKCGSVGEAVQLFDAMASPNEVSFTAMMGGLAQTGSVDDALRLFARMCRSGIRVDPVSVSSVLGSCAQACTSEFNIVRAFQLGQCIHALIVRKGFGSDQHVGNSLIDMYTKCMQMDEAVKVFESLPAVSIVSWNILITGFGQAGSYEKALEVLNLMVESGSEPNEVTYSNMLASCIRARDVPSARAMFEKIPSPSLTTWNTLLSGYCQEELHQDTVELFRRMQHQNVQPDRTTLAVILSSCSRLGILDLGAQVHSASVRLLLHNDMFVASGLVDMYSKCGQIGIARSIFNRMTDRDVVCWNAMISGLSIHSFNKEAFDFFKQMRGNGMMPTESTYASMINSCAKLSSVPQGRQIHAQVVKDGYDQNVYVGSALIDMYAKCGNMDEARLCFDTMVTKNIVAWNEMIHGYAQNGFGEKAVELFEHMLTTEQRPDSVTFIAVLTGCSHSGLIDEAIALFDSMGSTYGITPVAEHYTCLIDGLGRAGRLVEVEALIDRMPCKDDPILWEVLLAACAVHHNAELGECAAQHLFHLDPKNPSPYVLLSNIYASLGRHGDASGVRALMISRGVVKGRGYSWIDHKDGVRAFMVADDLQTFSGESAMCSNQESTAGVTEVHQKQTCAG